MAMVTAYLHRTRSIIWMRSRAGTPRANVFLAVLIPKEAIMPVLV